MNSFIETLKNHLKKYPLMQDEDIYKLAYQFYYGPAHFIKDKNSAYQYLLDEAKEYSVEEIIFEEVGDYYRCYLINDLEYLSSLFEAFYLSAKEKEQPLDGFIDILNEICAYRPSFSSFVNKMKEVNYPAISHSQIYRNNYHPHYRLINKKYAHLIKRPTK